MYEQELQPREPCWSKSITSVKSVLRRKAKNENVFKNCKSQSGPFLHFVCKPTFVQKNEQHLVKKSALLLRVWGHMSLMHEQQSGLCGKTKITRAIAKVNYKSHSHAQGGRPKFLCLMHEVELHMELWGQETAPH